MLEHAGSREGTRGGKLETEGEGGCTGRGEVSSIASSSSLGRAGEDQREAEVEEGDGGRRKGGRRAKSGEWTGDSRQAHRKYCSDVLLTGILRASCCWIEPQYISYGSRDEPEADWGPRSKRT